MKKETLKTIIGIIVGAIGGLLIGFNAGKLDNILNIILFTCGVILVAAAPSVVVIFTKNNDK